MVAVAVVVFTRAPSHRAAITQQEGVDDSRKLTKALSTALMTPSVHAQPTALGYV